MQRLDFRAKISSRAGAGAASYAAARQRQTDPVASKVLMIGRVRLPLGNISIWDHFS
jgi:hypothetical protein